MDICEKCGYPLQSAMFNVFGSDKASEGKELVCTNPLCPIGAKNAPPENKEE